MDRSMSVRTTGRTVVVGGYLVAVAIAGRPVWLAVLLGMTLGLVWAAPIVLAPRGTARPPSGRPSGPHPDAPPRPDHPRRSAPGPVTALAVGTPPEDPLG